MKEKTFNSLMKKTKKELIEIIFRKDDVHVDLNKKITSLEKDVSKQIELRKLKAKAQKVPGKIRVFSIIMLMCFLATYLIVIAYQVIRSVGVMF